MKLKSFGYLILSLSVLSASYFTSPALAEGESRPIIEQSHMRKQKLIQFLHDRIARHEQMTLEEIKAEVLATVDENRQMLLKSKDGLMPEVAEKVGRFEQKIRQIESKEEFISFERESEKPFVSAINIVFGICRAYTETTNPDPGSIDWTTSFFVLVFICFPADFVLLPFEVIISIATGS